MDVVIYGGGSFASLMRYYFDSDSNYKVAAYCVDEKYYSSSTLGDLQVYCFDRVEELFPPSKYRMFLAVGYSCMRSRALMYEKARKKGYDLVSYISSKASIDNSAVIGDNCSIFQGVNIEPFVKIGNNNILWSSVNICHDVIIGSNSFFAANCTVGGGAVIGDNCFLGFSSTVIQNVCLGDETLVGAASLVLNDTKPYSKNIGVPAKEVGSHASEGIKIK